MGDAYVYRGLHPQTPNIGSLTSQTSNATIRLLDLAPGADHDDISCSLAHHVLQDGLDYEALSYTWGNPDRKNKVKCGQSYLYVTDTLLEALAALRFPDKKRLLWIDQLCINQENIEERNQQVKIMHLIYSYATRTIVFLDSAGMPKLQSNMGNWALFKELRRAKKTGEGSTIKDYQHLFDHPWFQRVWILQEISMAKVHKVIVYYRGSVQKWPDLGQAASLMGSYDAQQSYDFIQMPPSVPRHKMIMSRWTTIADAKMAQFPVVSRYGHMSNRYNRKLYSWFYLWVEPRLTEALQDSRFCLATNPVDKIFSLLNMLNIDSISKELAWLLEVDYALPVAEVFSRAARYCMASEQSLEVLCYKEGQSTIENLPSWVPDWTLQRLFPIQRISTPLQYRSQFHNIATITKTWKVPRSGRNNKSSVATFSADGQTITVKGHKIDTIQRLSPTWQTAMDVPDPTLFTEWARVYTGDNASEITNQSFKPEGWLNGIKTTPLSICDFWLRVGRHARLMASDTLAPFHSAHPLQEEWKRSAYHRSRRRRGLMLYRQGLTAFLFYKDWLAMMLPYASIGRKVAAGSEGYFMLVPPETRESDEVYVLEGGGSIGHVLRRNEGTGDFEYVGAAYVHGLFGVKIPWGKWRKQSITLR